MEELKEEIAEWLYLYNCNSLINWENLDSLNREKFILRATEITLKFEIYLKDHNYVQLDEDQSYPPIPRKDIVHIIMERDTQLRKANFKKVK